MEDTKNTESLDEWEQIQLPTSREWEETAIITKNHNQMQENDLSIFPPSNHEGLRVVSPTPPSSKAPVVESPEDVEETKENVVGKSFEVLRSGMDWFVKRVKCYVVCTGGGFWLALAMVGVLASSMNRWILGAPRKSENNRLLILQVKEKDQKISQLLLQVAQLNEMLSASRKVPVHRIG